MIYLHLDSKTVLPIATELTAEVKRMNSSKAELYPVTDHHFVSFIDLMTASVESKLLTVDEVMANIEANK